MHSIDSLMENGNNCVTINSSLMCNLRLVLAIRLALPKPFTLAMSKADNKTDRASPRQTTNYDETEHSDHRFLHTDHYRSASDILQAQNPGITETHHAAPIRRNHDNCRR